MEEEEEAEVGRFPPPITADNPAPDSRACWTSCQVAAATASGGSACGAREGLRLVSMLLLLWVTVLGGAAVAWVARHKWVGPAGSGAAVLVAAAALLLPVPVASSLQAPEEEEEDDAEAMGPTSGTDGCGAESMLEEWDGA